MKLVKIILLLFFTTSQLTFAQNLVEFKEQKLNDDQIAQIETAAQNFCVNMEKEYLRLYNNQSNARTYYDVCVRNISLVTIITNQFGEEITAQFENKCSAFILTSEKILKDPYKEYIAMEYVYCMNDQRSAFRDKVKLAKKGLLEKQKKTEEETHITEISNLDISLFGVKLETNIDDYNLINRSFKESWSSLDQPNIPKYNILFEPTDPSELFGTYALAYSPLDKSIKGIFGKTKKRYSKLEDCYSEMKTIIEFLYVKFRKENSNSKHFKLFLDALPIYRIEIGNIDKFQYVPKGYLLYSGCSKQNNYGWLWLVDKNYWQTIQYASEKVDLNKEKEKKKELIESGKLDNL